MLSWCLYHIAKDPEVKSKVLAELREAEIPTDAVPTWSVVNHLPYMTQVLKETLRLHPVLPYNPRQTIKEEKYQDKVFPADTLFFPMIFSLHRDPRHYPCEDVTKFNPDHFSPENIKNRHPYAWIPFSAGVRNCIGMQFAMVEARTVLAYILPRFDFTITNEPEITERLVLASKNMKARVKRS